MKRGFSLILFLVVVSVLLCVSPHVGAKPVVHRVATGVLYYMDGGTGSGSIGIFTGRGVLEIDYENPRKEYGFRNGSGYQLGAIWGVRYHEERYSPEDAEIEGVKTHLVLESARFTGRFDEAVKSANEFIYRHYALLAKGDYQNAYRDLSASMRARQPYESFVAGFRSVKFYEISHGMVGPNAFLRYAVPENATTIISRSAQKVVIDVHMSKLVNGDIKLYRFDVVRGDEGWQIDKVAEIKEE
jgi:hypothetical protein